jgi:outer membrane biosynthesis protein TonB
MLVAVCVLVILARVYGVPLLARTTQMRKPPTVSTVSGLLGEAVTQGLLPTMSSTGVEKAEQRVTPLKPEIILIARKATPVPAGSEASIKHSSPAGPFQSALVAMSSPGVEKANQRVTPLKPETTFIARKDTLVPAGSEASITDSSPAGRFESAPVASSDASERLFVSELPQGQFIKPVADPSLVGELHLRALIDADGSVKEVTVVSGDSKLAEAGMRAVRRWHYSPYQAPGGSGEGETLIRMRFFGQDTVSITSIARPRSEPK